MDRLRGTFAVRWLDRMWRPWWSRVTVALLAVGVGSLGLSACVADPAPGIGTATAGDGEVVVSWQPPSTAPTPITAYVVTPWIGFTRQTPVVFNSPATTETVTGLTNGVTYRFTVHAVNANGDESAASDMSNAVTPQPIGRVFTWGNDQSGQLGDGDTPPHLTPVQVGTDTHWASVATGKSHTEAIKTDGTLWAWGDNRDGGLGDGTVTQRSSPVQIGTATNWASVAAGDGFTIATRTDGSLWVWGTNGYAQLGLGDTTRRLVPQRLGLANNWQSVTAGFASGLAIKSDGTLWGWGEQLRRDTR